MTEDLVTGAKPLLKQDFLLRFIVTTGCVSLLVVFMKQAERRLTRKSETAFCLSKYKGQPLMCRIQPILGVHDCRA